MPKPKGENTREKMVLMVFDSTGKELLKIDLRKYPPFEVQRFKEWAESRGYLTKFAWEPVTSNKEK